MQNMLVLEGVSANLSDDDVLELVTRHIGGVGRLHRTAVKPDVVFVQLGLENMASAALSVQALGFGCFATATPPCAIWVRAPLAAEFQQLAQGWRAERQLQRAERCLDRGVEPMQEDYELVMSFGEREQRQSSGCFPPFESRLRLYFDGLGTGSAIWPSGVLLAECLWQGYLGSLQSCRVLELGCGCAALPSVVAAHLGSSQVVATDVVDEVLLSAAENATPHGVSVRSLDWAGHTPGGSAAELAEEDRFDLVLWADVAYTERGGRLLAHAVLAHLRKDALCAAVLPPEDRPGLESFEREMSYAGYGRRCSGRCYVPEDVVTAAKSAQVLGDTFWAKVERSRLIVWEQLGLYD